MANYTCKVCGGTDLYKAIDLGVMPTANNLVPKEDLAKVKSYPLVFYWCSDCTFFQQTEIVPREELFNDKYVYMTGVNTPSVENYRRFAEGIKNRLPNRNLAVIIASNDGTEIGVLKESGDFKKVIGVDPAGNLAEIANSKGFFTINDFFSYELSNRIVGEHGNADFVAAKGVFAHIPDPRDMLMGMKNLINEDGMIAIEVHYLKSLVEELEIEGLYAEHYYVYDMKAMKYLANSMDLKVVDAEFLPDMSGGSIRFMLKKHGTEEIAERFIEAEKKAGLYNIEEIENLQRRSEERKEKFGGIVRELKAQGKRISVWTASAKVPTLLNFCGLSNKEIDYAYDMTETKIGKFIPKANIEVKRESLIEQDMPDYLIIGSWNYIEFAMKKLRGYMDKGGKLINPLTCEIIG
jgi:hypothetical protein